jgi:hypothetical protein
MTVDADVFIGCGAHFFLGYWTSGGKPQAIKIGKACGR